MLKLLKVFGIILIPFVLIFIYVYVSSSGLVGNLPKDGDIISKQRPVEKSDLDLINRFNVSNKAIIGGISNENFHEVAELNFDMIALSNAIFNSQDTAKSASFFVNNFNFE